MARLSGDESDGELYKRSIGGDRVAVEALVERHHADLTLYLRSKTNVMAAVDDAVAEAWLRFFRHLKEAAADHERALHKPESIRFWLYRTALNALNDQFRSSGRQTDLAKRATVEAEAQGHTAYQPDELAGLEGDERRSALREAFRSLGDRCRELLGLLATDPPLSYAEVAELTGRPIGSIGPTRQRCLADLRKLMGVTS
ncbi:MAG: sigma-70 family RNA polymerase sigma factor [Actinomycetota bacterium]